jgi:hypothetical protein
MAAAPAAMAGLAAAFALGNAPAATAATVDASGHHTTATAVTPAAPQAAFSAELLVSVSGQPATGPVIRLDADPDGRDAAEGEAPPRAVGEVRRQVR